mmetsp:Transcript_16865/g.51856  ORF Transcript_16865/g.51856 Transcript_16865/m.51856 type:complete len:291 (-) Transcript_16865:338-1210(-)
MMLKIVFVSFSCGHHALHPWRLGRRDALLPVTSGDFVGNGGHGEAANADFYDGVPEILNDDVKELAELAERLPRERGAPVAGARGGLLLWPVDQRVHLIFPRFELQRLRSVAHAIERERSGKPLYRVREAANCARRGERVATEDPFQLGQALCSLGDALRDDLHKELLVPGRLHQCIGIDEQSRLLFGVFASVIARRSGSSCWRRSCRCRPCPRRLCPRRLRPVFGHRAHRVHEAALHGYARRARVGGLTKRLSHPPQGLVEWRRRWPGSRPAALPLLLAPRRGPAPAET